MKLNTRLWLLVFPVLVAGTLMAVLAIYTVEKKLVLESDAERLKQYSIRLVSEFTVYNNLSESYLEPLLRSAAMHEVLLAKDEFILAYSIENNLTNMLGSLSKLRLDKFSLSIFRDDGSIKYFFEDSNDPFSEPSDLMIEMVGDMFLNHKSWGRKVSTEDEGSSLTQARILDPLTLRTPVTERWQSAVAVAVHFGMPSLDEIIQEGRDSGYKIRLVPSESLPALARPKYDFYFQEHLIDGYWIYVEYDTSLVDQKLGDLLFSILVVALLSSVSVAYVLLKLIEFYVTRPILRLEQAVVAVDGGGALPEPGMARDEVSALARAFHKLYSQLKSSSEAYQEMAETDHLTHLLNRRQFNQTLINILDRIEGGKKLALLYIDLDNFKYVNDNYGHDVGDQLLVEFSERLKQQFRPTDLVLGLSNSLSRLGGDEFCVLLADFEQDSVVQKAAERVVAMFADGFTTRDGNFPVSASVGVAVYPRDGETAEELMVNADASMYLAKKAGKNQFAFYSQSLAEKNQRYIQVEVALKNVDYSEFSMVYMPQVASDSGKISGVEALICWHSPELGFVSPAEFIPIAESTGVFKELDIWVFRKVLSDRPRLQEILGDDVRISVNISAAQLNSGSFFLDLMMVLQQMNQSSSGLVLEITETFAAIKSETLLSNLSLLKQAGFELALDDFGTGYASMVQLVDYPIDEIKIDKYLIDNLDGKTRDMIEAIATFFTTTGYRVTAEGVETPEQVEILKGMDVDTLQGYYYSKPVPLEQLAEVAAG